MNKQEYLKLWKLQNKERIREYHRLYRRKFYLRDKEKIKQAVRKWQKNNKEKVLEYFQKYKLKHPEKVTKWEAHRAELLKFKRLEERQEKFYKQLYKKKEAMKKELSETNRRLENYKDKELTFDELMMIILKKK